MATAVNENLDPKKFDAYDGYETYHNNRSQRAKELIDTYDKISLEDLKRIKFDRQLPAKILYPYGYDASVLFTLDASKYPALATIIKGLKEWDHVTNIESVGALYYNILYYGASKIRHTGSKEPFTETEAVEVVQYVHDFLMKNYGRLDVTLGEFQRLKRGDQDWPQAGMPDVLAAVMSEPFGESKRKMISGDAYIGFVKFPKDGGLPLIETVNTFGASSHPESKHYADQRELYQAQKTKRMTLDKDEVLKNAEKIYHPE
jgi:acyl-homoserine-lactone acylase